MFDFYAAKNKSMLSSINATKNVMYNEFALCFRAGFQTGLRDAQGAQGSVRGSVEMFREKLCKQNVKNKYIIIILK